MIINEDNIKKQNIITVAVAIALGIVLVTLVVAVRPDFPYYWSIAIEAVCGIILAVSLGLCINEDTRVYGILYAAVTILTPLFSIIGGMISGNYVTTDVLLPSYGIGILIGAIYSLIALKNGYTEKLAKALKTWLSLFICLVVAIIITYSILIPIYTRITYFGIPTTIVYDELTPYIISLACIIILFVLHNKFILNRKIGIDGSSVFVVGPPGSGKTYFAIGLYDYFSSNRHVVQNALPALNRESPNKDDQSIMLSHLHAKMLENHTLPHTKVGQLSTYEFVLKKFKFIPITWTVMDYPGERYTNFHKDNYDKALEKVMATMKEIDNEEGRHRNWSVAKIEDKARTLDLIPLIQKEYARRDYEFIDSVVIVIMYIHFISSSKIIFLVDGDQLKEEWLKNHDEDKVDGVVIGGEVKTNLNSMFHEYTKIITDLGVINSPKIQTKIDALEAKKDGLYNKEGSSGKIKEINDRIKKLRRKAKHGKKIAFVVSKTDILTNSCTSLQKIIERHSADGRTSNKYSLSDIYDNEDAIKELETKLYSMLNSDDYQSFKECMKKIKEEESIPTYFIAGSIDSQTGMDDAPGSAGRLHQFGFSEIEKFGK